MVAGAAGRPLLSGSSVDKDVGRRALGLGRKKAEEAEAGRRRRSEASAVHLLGSRPG